MGRALGPSREQNSNSRPLLKVKSNSQRAADKKKGGGKSASAQPIFRIPGITIFILISSLLLESNI
jgi:hypothetical protein